MNNLNKETQTQLIESILVQFDPQTDSETRNEAYKFTERFKDSENIELMIDLTSKDNYRDEVRYFGLLSLEYVLKKNWKRESTVFSDLRESVLDLFLENKGILGEPNHIKEKIVSLVVNLAKRLWPHEWKDMIPELLIVSGESATQCELALLFIRSFSEELYEFVEKKDLSPQRLSALQTALKESSNEIISKMIVPTIQSNYEKVSQNEKLDEQEYEVCSKLLKASLRAISSMLGWLPRELIFNLGFLNALPNFLTLQPFQQLAAQALLHFGSNRSKELIGKKKSQIVNDNKNYYHQPYSSRTTIKLNYDEKEILRNLIGSLHDFYFGQFKTSIETYEFEKQLAYAVSSIFKGFIFEFVSPFASNDNKLMNNTKKYFNILLNLSQHPSIQICDLIANYWEFLFDSTNKKPIQMERKLEIGISTSIFDFAYMQIPKFLPIAEQEDIDELEINTDFPEKQYILFDFSDLPEFIETFQCYKSKLFNVFKYLTWRNPNHLIGILINHLILSIQQYGELNSNQNENENEVGFKQWFYKFHSLIDIAQGIIEGIDKCLDIGDYSENVDLMGGRGREEEGEGGEGEEGEEGEGEGEEEVQI